MARLVLLMAALAGMARAFTPPESLENTGKPMHVPYVCNAKDLDSLGLSCTEHDPCPIYLELSVVEAVGDRLFLAGNIHTSTATIESILLGSTDRGKTWVEPYDRIRSAALDLIQFFDAESGWISGAAIQTLPRDPFFLLTSDGGKTWRQRPLFEETHQGSIDRFWFDSPKNGALLLTPVGGSYEMYETQTGGDSWILKQVSSTPLSLPHSRPPGERPWRLRPDARSHAYNVETRETAGWQKVASFLVDIGACK